MMNTLINLIKITLYSMIIVGLWLIYTDYILYFLKVIKPKKTFREIKEEPSSNLYKHIKRLMLIVYGKDNDKKVSSFYLISVLLFFLTFLIVIQRTSIIRSFIFAGFISFIPYIFLRLQLKQIRIEGSYEADIFVNEFLNQYKLNNKNIYDAIDETIDKIKNAPIMKRQMFIMALKLKEYRNVEELEEIIKDFVYAINTEWIVLLANNIYISITDNINITIGLEDIQKEIKQAITDKEREKRINLESVTIVKFITPGLYIISMIVAKSVFNISFKQFFEYQINTPTGFNYFMIIIIMSILNSSILILLKKQKFDI
ncbi:MAG: hypothetical protein N4A63_15660 [Vallitalea sp.]|nr:hypothetical protein [Vallitalea sp.]